MESISNIVDFLIIGAPKCGTTSLSSSLRQHSQVYIPYEKEIGFFSNEKNWSKGLEWYKKKFDTGRLENVVGESTPHYLYSEKAPTRISRLLPNVKIIVLVRNPIDRANSHYWFRRRYGTEKRNLKKAFREEISKYINTGQSYLIKPGIYSNHIDKFIEHFGKGQIKVNTIKGTSESDNAVTGLLEFLEVRKEEINIGRKNESKAPVSKRYRDMVQKLIKYEGYIKRIIKKVTSKSFRKKLKEVMHEVNMKKKNKPDLPGDIKNRLRKIYKGEQEYLSSKFNVTIKDIKS